MKLAACCTACCLLRYVALLRYCPHVSCLGWAYTLLRCFALCTLLSGLVLSSAATRSTTLLALGFVVNFSDGQLLPIPVLATLAQRAARLLDDYAVFGDHNDDGAPIVRLASLGALGTAAGVPLALGTAVSLASPPIERRLPRLHAAAAVTLGVLALAAYVTYGTDALFLLSLLLAGFLATRGAGGCGTGSVDGVGARLDSPKKGLTGPISASPSWGDAHQPQRPSPSKQSKPAAAPRKPAPRSPVGSGWPARGRDLL